ncbi:50S ribosomal protein L10 [Desulfoplanes formicivorans]|uniref:Large ribosomal subunit protein uL10 n=1 Tax=Desulfoplanes formicivorans TaxID=1592317 RepID=A0A194AEL9_9BACT|nr:50S ribosomal protein L10 [Desulfoplanes formicivorans]GAU07551.1 50S ribosomal protein L10 [Desulfoplanes formicivorans]
MNRAEKAKIIDDLKAKADKANIAVVTDFKGLKVEQVTPLRKSLREGGVEYQVVKNTLARIAFTDTPCDVLKDNLKDCCAVAFGYDDPVIAAKILTSFAKKNDKFAVRFGALEGKFLDDKALAELATLPGKEELLAKTLGTMNAVPQNFVCLFANLVRNMLYALTAIKDQKEQ